MKFYNLIFIILLYFIVGCSGIRGSGGTIEEEPVTKTNKIFKGKISQVDESTHEITINGVQISALGAAIYRNSVLLPNDGLHAGQIVSIETGSSNKKGKFSALKIEIEDQIQGPISAIDLQLNTITILDQTVHVTLATSFTEKSLKTLKINFYLAVFGFRNSSGVLEATLIELLREDFQASKDTVKLAGEVAVVNIESGNIVVEGVEIKLGLEEIKEIKVGDVLSLNGLEVSAENPDTLISAEASSDIKEETTAYDLNREIALEGLPQKITARNMFSLNGYQVVVPLELMDADSITSVEDRKLIINGTFTGEKEVLASSIRVEQIKDFEFRGLLKTTGLENKISVFNKEIDINIYTSIDFDLKEVVLKIEKGSLNPMVYVKGYVESSGKRVATNVSINLDDKEQFEYIKGKIENIENELINISGVTLKLNGFIIYKNEDKTLNITEMLSLIKVGDRIEVSGGFNVEKNFIVYFLTKSAAQEVEGNKSELISEQKNKKGHSRLK